MGGPSERQVGPASITLRPAGPGDERRLRAMFAADRAVLFTGLPPDVAADLVAMQWEAQRRGHAQAFPAATTLLVVASGDVVGRLVVDWGVDPIHVVDLVVDLHVRRRGIATAVMTHVRDRAAHAGRGVTLSVARDNEPAERFSISTVSKSRSGSTMR